jgi:hypothetical protein
VLLSPFVKVIVEALTEAVIRPLRGSEEVKAKEALVELKAYDALRAYDELNILFNPLGPYTADELTQEAEIALVAQEAVPVRGPVNTPWKDPLNEPECTNPVALVVATILPVPLIDCIPRVPLELPVTTPFSRLSTCKDAKLAALPETMTFFHDAIVCYFYLY